jgi:hypothetical protein
MLYNIEFQVQQLERRVSHASGKRSLEETLELKAEIQRQQQVLEDMNDQYRMINNQVCSVCVEGVGSVLVAYVLHRVRMAVVVYMYTHAHTYTHTHLSMCR